MLPSKANYSEQVKPREFIDQHQDFTVSRRRQERPAWEWTGIKAVPENWEARLEIKGKKIF